MFKLEPCPFCGCNVIRKYENQDYSFRCECARCNAKSADYRTILEAIEAWNIRAEKEPPAPEVTRAKEETK